MRNRGDASRAPALEPGGEERAGKKAGGAQSKYCAPPALFMGWNEGAQSVRARLRRV
ncbi:MAG TPA: hypothetical protein VGB76_13375 [Pyrinomonadaceae bacterium]